MPPLVQLFNRPLGSVVLSPVCTGIVEVVVPAPDTSFSVAQVLPVVFHLIYRRNTLTMLSLKQRWRHLLARQLMKSSVLRVSPSPVMPSSELEFESMATVQEIPDTLDDFKIKLHSQLVGSPSKAAGPYTRTHQTNSPYQRDVAKPQGWGLRSNSPWLLYISTFENFEPINESFG